MFNIGGGEVLVIALIALIAVGPEQLPSVMRKVGGFVGQIRGMTAGLRDEFMSGVDDLKSTIDDANPKTWMGDGSDEKPIVPRGYAENTVNSTANPTVAAQEDPAPTNAGGASEASTAELSTAELSTAELSTAEFSAPEPPTVDEGPSDDGPSVDDQRAEGDEA